MLLRPLPLCPHSGQQPFLLLEQTLLLSLGIYHLDLPLAALLALHEVLLVPPDERPASLILTDTVCPLVGEPIAPGSSVTTSLFVPLLVNAAQTSCVSSRAHIQCLPDVPHLGRTMTSFINSHALLPLTLSP